MVRPLELDDGKISYEFDPQAVFEKGDNRYEFISFKKISSFMGKDKKKQEKFQNLTVKPAHKEEFIEWLQECLDELRGDVVGQPAPDDDVPF
jgi:hypothetical protein